MGESKIDYDLFSKVLKSEQNRRIKDAQNAGIKGVGSALGGIGKSALNASVTENKKYGKTLANLYTGKKLNPIIGAGVGLAGVGIGLSRMNSASTDLRGQDAAALNELGHTKVRRGLKSNAPAPSASTVAPSVMAGGHITGAANDMGATGDMVFGMHNKRHG